MTITLTPEIERKLSREANRYGTTPELLALETLQKRFAEPASSLEGMSLEGMSLEGMPLDVALRDLIAEAEVLEPQSPPPGTRTSFDEILAAKYRAQGIDV